MAVLTEGRESVYQGDGLDMGSLLNTEKRPGIQFPVLFASINAFLKKSMTPL